MGENMSLYIVSSEMYLLHNDDRANIYAALPLAWKQPIGFKGTWRRFDFKISNFVFLVSMFILINVEDHNAVSKFKT